MDARNFIKQKLLSLGAKEAELKQIIKDVNGVVAQKIVQNYFAEFSEEQKNKLAGLSPEEMLKYVEQHQDEFSAITKELIEKTAQEVWTDYLQSMKE